MEFLKRIQNWLKSVPAWVWLFLTLTQALNVVVSTSHLIKLPSYKEYENWKGKTREDQAIMDEVLRRSRDLEDRSRTRDKIQLIVSSVLCPVFLGMGIWRWRSSATQNNDTTEQSPVGIIQK
jgi:hypothetical protein